jgi:hypothetical protein
VRSQKVTELWCLITAVFVPHTADQPPKPANGWVAAKSRRKLTKNIKQTFFAVGLDNVGFIEAQYEVLGYHS